MNTNLIKLKNIAKEVNFPLPITNVNMVYELIDFTVKKKIELSTQQHDNLLSVIDTSSNTYIKLIDTIYKKYEKAIEHSNKIDLDYTEKLIEIYNPSQAIKDRIYEEDNKSKNRRSEQREKDQGTVLKIVTTILSIGVGVVSHNLTKSRPFWHK